MLSLPLSHLQPMWSQICAVYTTAPVLSSPQWPPKMTWVTKIFHANSFHTSCILLIKKIKLPRSESAFFSPFLWQTGHIWAGRWGMAGSQAGRSCWWKVMKSGVAPSELPRLANVYISREVVSTEDFPRNPGWACKEMIPTSRKETGQ